MKEHKGIKILLKVILAAAAVFGALAIFLFGINEWSITVTVHGKEFRELEYGDVYTDAGAEAHLHGSIVFTRGWLVDTKQVNEVDLSTTGEKEIYYTAEKFGLTGEGKRVVTVVDTKKPEITLTYKEGTYTIPGDAYKEEGYAAADNYDGDLSTKVEREEKDGVVYYKVSDSSGNIATAEREIYYWDPIVPVLTLVGETSITLGVGTAYVEPGFTATDNVDGDLTNSVSVTGTVDANKIGTYTLTYSVADGYHNEATAQRTIIYEDKVVPTLTLKGDKNITLLAGNNYSEAGYTANDNYDGDITSLVKIDGTVDTSKVGTYTITYTVADSSGNKTSASRTIVVNPKPTPTPTPKPTAKPTQQPKPTNTPTLPEFQNPGTVTPNGKVIYLTFDDGPSRHTQRLLDILAKYNVKATFFTVKGGYDYMLAKEAAAGHTVAIHSTTHNYAEIYASEDAYLRDMEKQQNLILKQTGIKTNLFRFPGGSSNTVSKRYNKGIMSRLTKKLTNMGYKYFDWNVSSGDAGEATTAEEVFQNVISGVQKQKVSIVLQHDIQGFSVDAVERIIVWGLQNGYTFLPLDASSPTVHHPVQN